MKRNKLIDKSLLYFIGNFSSRILSFFLLPIYAYYVASEDLGYFDYYQTVMRIVTPIVFLAIWEAILKFIIREKNDKKKFEIIGTVNTFIFIVLVLGIALTLGLNKLIYGYTEHFYLIIIMMGISALTRIWQYYARSLSENKLYVIAGIAGSISYLIFTIIFIVIFRLGFNGLLWSFILSQTSIYIIIESKLCLFKRYSLNQFNFSILLKLIKFSAPLVVNFISLWLITGANKIIITKMIGAGANGLYSFANRFSVIITMLGTIVSMSLIEEAYSFDDIKKYAQSFSNIIQRLFRIYFSLIVLAVPAIRLMYTFLEETAYYKSADFIFLLLLSALFTSVSNSFGSAFQVTNKTQYIFITTLIGAIVSIGGALISLNYIGIYGVLISQLIGTIIMAVSRASFAYRLTGLSISWDRVIYPFIYVIGLGIIGFLDNLYILSILIVFNAISIYYINRRDITKIYRHLLSYIKK